MIVPLSRSGELFCSHWRLFLSISALITFPIEAAYHITVYSTNDYWDFRESSFYDEQSLDEDLLALVIVQTLQFGVYVSFCSVLYSIGDGAIVRAVADICNHADVVDEEDADAADSDAAESHTDDTPPTFGASLTAGRLAACKLMSSTVLVVLSIVIPVICALPVLYLAVVVLGILSGDASNTVAIGILFVLAILAVWMVSTLCYFVHPVVMMEEKGAFAAINNSITLSRDHRRLICCLVAAFGVQKAAVHVVSLLAYESEGLVLKIALHGLSMSLSILTIALGSICKGIVYVNVRAIKKDELNHATSVTTGSTIGIGSVSIGTGEDDDDETSCMPASHEVASDDSPTNQATCDSI